MINGPLILGSPSWRNWIKPKIAHFNSSFVLFDALTLHIAKNAAYKAVESSTAKLIADLQESGHAVFAFTARGRSQWYTTDLDGVDRFTHEQLLGAGMDFKRTQIPEKLLSLEEKYFLDGIIFAQHIAKGDLLKHLFKDLNYHPSLIVFVDDKLEQVQSVEKAVKEAGIPFLGFWYRHAEYLPAPFDPMLTNIQLEALLLQEELVDDATAGELASNLADEPHTYLENILKRVDLKTLVPTLDEYQTQSLK